SILLSNIKKMNLEQGFKNIVQEINSILNNIGDSPLTFEYIKDHFIEFIEKMMTSIDDIGIAKNIPELFKKYNYDYDSYCDSDEGFQKILNVIEKVLISNEDELKYYRENDVTEIEEVKDIYYELNEIENDLKSQLFPNNDLNYNFGIEADDEYWKYRIIENKERIAFEEEQAVEDYKYYREMENKEKGEDRAIEDLFIKHT
ncbi:MAG TPA: hypothetical protein VIK14_17245, partial [Ignavibacteria bacterium]